MGPRCLDPDGDGLDPPQTFPECDKFGCHTADPSVTEVMVNSEWTYLCGPCREEAEDG